MTKLTDLTAKYERKLKKEYQRGYDDGVRDEARVKRAVKMVCPRCKIEIAR